MWNLLLFLKRNNIYIILDDRHSCSRDIITKLRFFCRVDERQRNPPFLKDCRVMLSLTQPTFAYPNDCYAGAWEQDKGAVFFQNMVKG